MLPSDRWEKFGRPRAAASDLRLMGSDEGVEPAVEGVTFRGVDGGLSDMATEVAVFR